MKRQLPRQFVFLSLIVLCFGQSSPNLDGVLYHAEDKCAGVLENCYCTNVVVDCNGGTFSDIKEIKPFLTNSTVRISLTNGNLRTISSGVFTDSSLITYMNLSGNPLEFVHEGVFSGLIKLRVLDLSVNENLNPNGLHMSSVNSTFYPLANLEHLSIKHANVSRHLENIVHSLLSLKNLDISYNGLTSKDEGWIEKACDNINLTFLNCSNNNFDALPLTQCLTNLEVFDVSNNNIKFLDKVDADIIEDFMNLKQGFLHGNPWTCSCSMHAMFDWLKQTQQPLDVDNMHCYSINNISVIDERFKVLDYWSMCEPRIAICYGPNGPIYVAKSSFVLLIGGGIVLLTFGSIIALVCYRRRRRTQRRHPEAKGSRIIEDSPKSPMYNRVL